MITIGIIGLGRFGTLVASVLSKCAKVKAYHYKNNEEIRQRAQLSGAELASLKETVESDIVILSVSMSKTEAIIKEIAPLVKKGALVLDTCSVKVYPCQWLEKHLPEAVEIMGTHPMFGPVTTKFQLEKQEWYLQGLQIVLCPLRIEEKKLTRIKKFLSDLGLKVIITTPEEHDSQNAYTLGLVHFLGRALVASGVGEQEIFTPGYADLLKIIPHTASDNWQLFYDMHNLNPYAKKIRKKFMRACQSLDEKIKTNG